jgi:hypothetical protein
MLTFLQIFFIITWVINLYTILQRLIDLEKYGKAFAVNLLSQMLKKYNPVMFVLLTIRDQVQLKMILRLLFLHLGKGGCVF